MSDSPTEKIVRNIKKHTVSHSKPHTRTNLAWGTDQAKKRQRLMANSAAHKARKAKQS